MSSSLPPPTANIKCRFCHATIATKSGELGEMERHMKVQHAMVHSKELAKVLNLLSWEEVDTIVAKLRPRVTFFTTTGVLDYQVTLIDDDEYDECEAISDDEIENEVSKKGMAVCEGREDDCVDKNVNDWKNFIQKKLDNNDLHHELDNLTVPHNEVKSEAVSNEIKKTSQSGKDDSDYFNKVQEEEKRKEETQCNEILVSEIRRIEETERESFKRGMELDWVQLCVYCDQWVGRLTEHVKSVHKDKNYRMIKTLCPFDKCERMVVDIKNHIRLVHKRVRNFVCKLCKAGFTSSYHLYKHMSSVHDNLKVECGQCGSFFKTTTIDSHVKRVHQGIRRSIPCTDDSCQKIFGSKEDMKRHVRASHMKLKLSCHECGKRMRMEFLRGHMKKEHKS